MYREAELVNLQQTATEMYRLASAWRDDMAPYASMSPQELFDFLKDIPFNADPDDETGEGMEFLQRSYYTVTQSGPGGDCDDKAICVGAWANLRNIPFRFVAVSRSDEPLHHVLTELYIQGVWWNFDPTYAFNVLGRPDIAYPQRQILTPQ